MRNTNILKYLIFGVFMACFSAIETNEEKPTQPRYLRSQEKINVDNIEEADLTLSENVQNKELNFIVLGDFGHVDKTGAYGGAQQLSAFIQNRVETSDKPYDFILSAGDVIYHNGIKSTTDVKPRILLKDTYKIDKLGLDWYSVLGNHDYMGNIPATLALGKRFSQWKSDELYSQKTFNIGDSNLKAGFIFLNGNEIVCLNKNHKECYQKMHKNVNFDNIEDQIAWLENVLISMSEDQDIIWKIVVIHQAIFSKGNAHGDNQVLQERILPLLVKYKVDLVLSGHDHSVQYLRMNLEDDLTQDNYVINPKKSCMKGEFLGEFKSKKSEVSRDYVANQHDHLHQFVFGNGGFESQRFCPGKHAYSDGRLIYGNTVMGIGDIKIAEDAIEVKLVSAKNEVLYSVKIARQN